MSVKIPKTIEERDALLRKIATQSLRDAFMAGWVAGQFSVLPDTPEAITNVCDSLNEHECEEAFRLYMGAV